MLLNKMKPIKHMMLLMAIIVVMVTAGCAAAPSKQPFNTLSWQQPSEGQEVYGIVKLEVKVNGEKPQEVGFYLDTIESGNFIGFAARESNSVYSYDWYTQKYVNAGYLVLAVARFNDGSILQSSIPLHVNNRTRLDAIPATTVKMTPENDSAPPVLNPAFKHIWHEPMPLEGPVNTAGAEDSPFITPDGNTLYFWFNGDQSKDVHLQVKDPMTGLYWAKKVDGEWQEPERLFLQYFNRIGFDGDPSVHGNTLWFGSIREGNYRDIDIWTAEFVNGRWVNWSNAGEILNEVYEIGELHITADGNEMYFGSTRAGGKGQSDIWVTSKVDGEWQDPENIIAVNTQASEGQPFISEDGNELWFTRLTPAPAIFRSLKVDGKWQPPELVLSNLAGEPTLDAAGNLYFVHHRWDDTLARVTEADIYVCYRK